MCIYVIDAFRRKTQYSSNRSIKLERQLLWEIPMEHANEVCSVKIAWILYIYLAYAMSVTEAIKKRQLSGTMYFSRRNGIGKSQRINYVQ